MNPEIKTRWVAALRSGKYQQGRRKLRYQDQFCCLGVLCDLALQAGQIDIRPSRHSPETGPFFYEYGRFDQPEGMSDSLVPLAVQEWAGVNLNPGANGKPLSNMNDTGMDFNTIADYIEEYL